MVKISHTSSDTPTPPTGPFHHYYIPNCKSNATTHVLDGWLGIGLPPPPPPREFCRLSGSELKAEGLLRNVCTLCVGALVCKSL